MTTHFQSILCACFVCFVVKLHAQVELRWDAQIERPSSYEAPVYRGETIHLMPRLVRGSLPVDLAAATATLYWQTNGMGQAWWSKPAGVYTSDPGRALATFAPTNDFGAAAYTWFIRVTGDGGSAYRAMGTLSMRDSPGWSPTAAPPAPYQWVTPADLQAVSNALAGALQDASGAWYTAATNVTAAAALRVISPTTNAWISVDTDGTGRVTRISQQLTTDRAAGTSISIVSSSGDYDGPSPGTLFMRDGDFYAGAEVWTNGNWTISVMDKSGGVFDLWLSGSIEYGGGWQIVGQPTLPATLVGYNGRLGDVTLSWSHTTNIVDRIATSADLRQSIAAIPRVPTNAVQGWLLYDAGSNMWLRVTVSNLAFTVWEVTP